MRAVKGYVVINHQVPSVRALGCILSMVLGLLFLFAACEGARPTPTPSPAGGTTGPLPQTPVENGTLGPSEDVVLVLPLFEQGASGKTGIAVMTGNDRTTNLVLMDSPITYATVEPAHIYTGTCDDLGGVVYALNGVLDGSSTTALDVPLSKLQQGTYVINLHKSVAAISSFIACGAIPIADDAVTIGLGAVDEPGQSGHATLIRRNGKTWVAISATLVGEGAAQPANIHSGGCANPGAVAYPLADLVDGMSVTQVYAPLDELLANGLAVTLHAPPVIALHSDDGASARMACGEIERP